MAEFERKQRRIFETATLGDDLDGGAKATQAGLPHIRVILLVVRLRADVFWVWFCLLVASCVCHFHWRNLAFCTFGMQLGACRAPALITVHSLVPTSSTAVAA